MAVPELLATCWTIAGDVRADTAQNISPFSLEDRIAAAGAAGYTGIGLWHGDVRRWLETGSYAELRRLLVAAGLRHIELENLSDWFATGDARTRSNKVRQRLFETGAELGARHLKAMPPFGKGGWSNAQIVDSFGELCREAACHGLLVALEMVPFSDWPDLQTTFAPVVEANADNGGLLIDIWHVARSGAHYDEILQIPARFILGAEINDADRAVRGTLYEDTMRHRKFCGEGELDVPLFIARMTEAGYNGPYGVEILSDEVRAMTLGDVARRSFDTARAQFDCVVA